MTMHGGDTIADSEYVRFVLDERSGRTREDVLHSALIFDASLRLVAWCNDHMAWLGFPPEFANVGQPYDDLIRFHAHRGEYGVGAAETQVRTRLDAARHNATSSYRCTRADGTAFEVREYPLAGGGLVMIYTTVSGQQGVGLTCSSSSQQEKVEAIARLADGVAHDFNNPLTIIMMNLGFLEDAPGLHSDCLQAAQTALSAAQRGTQLTERLRAFSRGQDLRPELVKVPDLLVDVRASVERDFTSSFEIESGSADDVWELVADPNELSNAIHHLVANAREAMPTTGAKLAIHAVNAVVERDRATVGGDHAIEYVLLTVTDNGRGMSEQAVKHAFYPFFSTKDPATGHGLGLSIVYGFVKQSGGDIEIASTVGKGTTVKFYLPRAKSRTCESGVDKVPFS